MTIFMNILYLLILVVLMPGMCLATERFDVPVGDSPAVGPADAPVTIIEFLDYQ